MHTKAESHSHLMKQILQECEIFKNIFSKFEYLQKKSINAEIAIRYQSQKYIRKCDSNNGILDIYIR